MRLNKRGNIFWGVLIAFVIWFFGVLFIPFIYDTQIATKADLTCSIGTITYGNMMTCLVVSMANPYFIWAIIVLVVGYIIGSIK